MKLTILFVARHYPPHVSGATRRLSGFVEELRALGHTVYVAAPELAPEEDGVEVMHPQPVPSTGPAYSSLLERLRSFARKWLLWPDADIRWSRRAANELDQFAAQADWIITSSPPESAHAAGLILSRRHRIKWAADFRDPWIEMPLRAELRSSGLRRFLERRWARKVASRADLLLAVDERIAGEIDRLSGEARTLVIPHAANAGARTPKKLFDGHHFNLVHTGSFSLSDPDRTIEPLISAIEQIHSEAPNLVLHLAGRLTSGEIGRVKKSSAVDAIRVHGVVSPAIAASMQSQASALALVGATSRSIPPGKLVEYLAAQRPIVAFGVDLSNAGLGQEVEGLARLRGLLSQNCDEEDDPIAVPPMPSAVAIALSDAMIAHTRTDTKE